MKAKIVNESHKTGKSLSMYVKDRKKVNELMLVLIEAGFFVNYEPCYKDAIYEGCLFVEMKM